MRLVSKRRSSSSTLKSSISKNVKNTENEKNIHKSTVTKVSAENKPKSRKTAKLTIGSNKFYVDGVEHVFDSAPFISQSHTLIPLRAVAELFDAQVNWNGVTKTVKIISDGNEIIFTINSDIMVYNGSEIKLDKSAEIKGGRTYVPLRAIGIVLSAEVNWAAVSKTVTIVK